MIEAVYIETDIDLDSFDLCVFTSKEAINALQNSGIKLKGKNAIAVSAKTAEYARQAGMNVCDHAGGYGRELLELIKKKYHDKKLFFPHGKVLAFDLLSPMREANIEFFEQTVYETRCSRGCGKVPFEKDSIFIFTSPSTVRCFFDLYPWREDFYAVAIGKTTRDALPKQCKSVLAEETSIDACIEKASQIEKGYVQ